MDEFRMKNFTLPEDTGPQASVVNRSIPRALLQREIGFRSCRPSVEFQVAAEYELIIRNHEELRCELPGVPRSTFLMVFSADGTLVASTHGNHNVYITCATTGHNVKTLTGHPRTPWCIAFHPSSNQILASGCLGGQVRVWDLHGGSEVWNVESQTVIASLAFHPTERLLAIATYNELYFWDWSTPEPFIKCNTANEREKVRYVSFDPMGHNLITGIANYTSLTSQWDRVNVPSYHEPPPHSSESSTEAPRSSSSVRNPVTRRHSDVAPEPQEQVEQANQTSQTQVSTSTGTERDDRHVAFSENSAFQPCNQRSRNSHRGSSSESSNVFTDNEVRTGIQILSQHIDNMQHLCRARLEMMQLQQIRQMWDYLQLQIRSLHTAVYDESTGEQRRSNERPVTTVHPPNRDTSRDNDPPVTPDSPRHRQRRPFQPIYPRRELDEEEREILDVLDFLGPDDGSLRDILHEFGQRRRRAHDRNRIDESQHLSNYHQLLGPLIVPLYSRNRGRDVAAQSRPQFSVRPVVQERFIPEETNESASESSNATTSVVEHEPEVTLQTDNNFSLGIQTSPISSEESSGSSGSEVETSNCFDSISSRLIRHLRSRTNSDAPTDDGVVWIPVNRPEAVSNSVASLSQESVSSQTEQGVSQLQENEVHMETVSTDTHRNQNISNESCFSNSPPVSTNVNETPLPSTLNPSSLLSYLRNVSDTLANDKSDSSKTRTVDDCEPSTSSGESKCKRMKIDQKKLVKEKVFDVLIRALEDQVENTNTETPNNNNAENSSETVNTDQISTAQNVFNMSASNEPLNVELSTNSPPCAVSPSSDDLSTGFRGFPNTHLNLVNNTGDGVLNFNPDQYSDADEIDRCSTVTNISDSNLPLTNPTAQVLDTNITDSNHDLNQSPNNDCTLRPGTPFVIVENLEHPNILESHDSFLENPATSSSHSVTTSTVSSTLNGTVLPNTNSSPSQIQSAIAMSDNSDSNISPFRRQMSSITRARWSRMSSLRNSLSTHWLSDSRSRGTARRSRPFRRRGTLQRNLRNYQEYLPPISDYVSHSQYERPQTRFLPVNYSHNEAAGSNAYQRLADLHEPRAVSWRRALASQERNSIMRGFGPDSRANSQELRPNSISIAYPMSNSNLYQSRSRITSSDIRVRRSRGTELSSQGCVLNPRKRRSHSGEDVFAWQRSASNLRETGSDLSGIRSDFERVQPSQSSESGVQFSNSSTLEGRRSFQDFVRSKLTEFRGLLRRGRGSLSNSRRYSAQSNGTFNESLSHRRETSTSLPEADTSRHDEEFSASRLRRFPPFRPRFSLGESLQSRETSSLFPGYVTTNLFPRPVTSNRDEEYLSSRLRSFRLPRMSVDGYQSLRSNETPNSFPEHATSHRRELGGFRNFPRAIIGNTTDEPQSSQSGETSTSESIRNMIDRLESLVRQQREQRDILMRDLARERLRELRPPRMFGARLFSRSGHEVFESSSVPPTVDHDYDAFYIRNRGASSTQSSDNQENEDDPWEPVRRERLRATRDFTRRRARQVLGMMVDGLTQFFEESGLTRDTPHAVLDEQIYNLYVLLQLALELTDLLLFQIFSTRPQQSEPSWVRYAFRHEDTQSHRVPSIVRRLRTVIPPRPMVPIRRATNHPPSTSLDSVFSLRRHEETRSEIPIPPPVPRTPPPLPRTPPPLPRTPPPSVEEYGRNPPRQSAYRVMEGFLAIPTVHVNDVPVSVPSPPPPTRPRPQSPPPSPMRFQYSISIGNSVDESNNPAFEVWRVSAPNLRSTGRYLHPHIHNRSAMPDHLYGEPDEEFFLPASSIPSVVFRGPSLQESVIISEAPVTLNHRIQLWSFSPCQAPDITDTTKNVVVSECKIHNDASVDISSDGKMLVALLPSGRLNHTTMLGVYSLQWKSLGQCLYATSFDQNAVSVSLSPTSRHLLVGLASRRVPLLPNDQHVMAQIFHLEGARPGRAPGLRGRLIHLRDIDHSRDAGFTSVNCIRWLPGAGQGFVYGTNTGQLRLMR